MAAAISPDLVNITINDLPLQVPKGELIVESVKRLGLEIPIFCYHSRLKPVGMCRMCLVEVGFKQPDGSVRKMPKPQAGCTLPASEGMAIYTDTELVHKDRKGVLEFLLVNHPLDCPICDRGGECPLQNNTLAYGPSTSRFLEIKRHLPKAFPLSEYVKLDLERCIQCGRCVRFTEEISGDSQLAFRFRGASMQPSTFELRDFNSKFSGNVIEICPVGALTSAKYRFRARPWDLQTRPSVCTVCSNGCNVWFDYRLDKMVRINGRTNEGINEEWTCDRGKFGHEFYNENRIERPMIREGEKLVPTDWPTAYQAILSAFEVGGNKVAALGGSSNSNEDLYMLQRLFRKGFRSNNLDHRFSVHLPAIADRLDKRTAKRHVQNTIESLETLKGALVLATSLAEEEPILFLRLRKAWFQHGAKIVVAHHSATEADAFATHVLRYRGGTQGILAQGLLQAISGTSGAYTPEAVERETGVKREDLIAAAATLKETAATILATRSIYDLQDGPAIASIIDQLAGATGGTFNVYGLYANDEGADALGILPDVLPGRRPLSDSGFDDYVMPTEPGLGTKGVLEGAISGDLQALWLVGEDPIKRLHDPALARKAIEAVPFLVVQATNWSEVCEYASVVLPMAGPAETDGTFTNVEGRVQRLKQVLPTKNTIKPAFLAYAEILSRQTMERPLFLPRDIMAKIAETVPEFAGATYDQLGDEGYFLGSKTTARELAGAR